MSSLSLAERLFVWLQYCIPQHLISRLMWRMTRIKARWYLDWQINWFIRRYNVDMSIAENPDPASYADFNSFFTRALRADARSIDPDPNTITCPVDGAVSQLGRIDHESLIQAKGHDFSLTALLAGRDDLAAPFRNGSFATVYLSPRDYHRIHMPVCGDLQEMIYVPGKLFSVNHATVYGVNGIFAKNERVITLFNTEAGPMAVILVGAINVGSMETVWHGLVTPPYGKTIQTWNYEDKPVHLTRGDELGRFNMGSTVILLFPENTCEWDSTLRHNDSVSLGTAIARYIRG
ncbi:MAG: archaetidylserine decarboxylase [Granulosicoccaceae bacterium]|jgi:phosphatidylserine decarboxylase